MTSPPSSRVPTPTPPRSASPHPAPPHPGPPHPAPSRLRGARAGWLEPALIAILVLALLLGIAQIGGGLAFAEVFWPAGAFTLVFWTWIAAGLIAWWRRPGNGVGPLIVLGGIALYLGGIANVPAPLFGVLGSIFATSVFAVTVHLLHAFPSGRIRGRLSLATVVLGYVVSIGFDTAMMLVPSEQPGILEAFGTVQALLGGLVMVATAAMLTRRLIAADRRHRRVLLPLFVYGSLSVLLVPLAPLVVGVLGLAPEVSNLVQLVILACIPVAFLLGVLLGGFKRTSAVEALAAWLAVGGTARPAVEQAFAATLGDDSLRVVYWVPEREDYVDEAGSAVARDDADPDRGWIDVRVENRLVGAIGYDARMIGDPASVRRAGEVLAIAIDRERLTSELLASNRELVRSRQRLVEAAYGERSRIARDLHDGLQVQLVLLALEAQTIANAAETSPAASAAAEQLRRGIDGAAADLRSLVHNVLPAGLLEQGLTAAAEDLVDRLDMPAALDSALDAVELPSATAHTGYFVLAELLANAVKHSRASLVRIVLRQDGDRLLLEVSDDGVGGARVTAGGTGLRGLADRVAAFDGSFEIDSDAGAGTRVRVELPCG